MHETFSVKTWLLQLHSTYILDLCIFTMLFNPYRFFKCVLTLMFTVYQIIRSKEHGFTHVYTHTNESLGALAVENEGITQLILVPTSTLLPFIS